jgi:tetratricopeptide (TPR) repeat protein
MPSGLKRFWDAIKPPPAVEHREVDYNTRSWTKDLWNTIKPPPPMHGQVASPEQLMRRRRRRMVWAMVIVMAGAAWGVYVYITSAPKRAEAMIQQGVQLANAGNFAEAEKRFTNATNTYPQLANGYMERGLARLGMNQQDAALADLEQAIRMNPALARAHHNIGIIYRDRKDLRRALDELTLAIGIDPRPDTYYQRGQVYEALGDDQKAMNDYNLAIASVPDAPYYYRARALLKVKLGNNPGAATDRQRADEIEQVKR